MGERGVSRWRLAGIAVAILVALAGIAALASAGGTGSRPDPRTASVAACARTPAPPLFDRLPRGLRATPLDSLISDAIVDALSIPPEVARGLDAREIDGGERRLAGVLLAPVGRERDAVTNAFAEHTNGLPRTERFGRARGMLIETEVSGRHVAATLTFVGCRALVVGARDAATARGLTTALAGGG